MPTWLFFAGFTAYSLEDKLSYLKDAMEGVKYSELQECSRSQSNLQPSLKESDVFHQYLVNAFIIYRLAIFLKICIIPNMFPKT